VKWVRSGIGFTKHQKEMIRNLGLHRLNEVAVRADIPSVRGLVAKLPHFVEIVAATPVPAWASIPEYTISTPPPAPEAEAAAPTRDEGLRDAQESATIEVQAEAVPPSSYSGSAGDPELSIASIATAESGTGRAAEALDPDNDPGVTGDASKSTKGV